MLIVLILLYIPVSAALGMMKVLNKHWFQGEINYIHFKQEQPEVIRSYVMLEIWNLQSLDWESCM